MFDLTVGRLKRGGQIDSSTINPSPLCGTATSRNSGRASCKVLAEEYYGVAVKKGNTKVLEMINAGLRKIFDAGDNKAFEQKWLK